jgi:hypothetical protein
MIQRCNLLSHFVLNPFGIAFFINFASMTPLNGLG